MISVALFQTIQEWHNSGVEKREIARRLKIGNGTPILNPQRDFGFEPLAGLSALLGLPRGPGS